MRQLMHTFEGFTAPPAILAAVGRGEITAFCLFRHKNVESLTQLRALTASLRQAAESNGYAPPLIGIDQEGGQLIAISLGATELPGNMALGAARSPELAEQAGMVLGRELLALGVNLNFAPSLDVNVNPDNVSMGTRTFGDDPALVAELGTALIRGLTRAGVIATAKHFPGHGDTDADSHYSVPVVSHNWERLNAVELPPFRAAIAADIPAIMTGHVLVTALDPDNVATISPVMVRLLRETLGYRGLLMTDAMDMHAVAALGHRRSLEAALDAGVDLLVLAHIPDQLALAEVLRPLENAESIGRIAALQARIPPLAMQPPLAIVGCAEHQAIAQTIADRSITLVRDNGRLPLRPSADATIAVITPEPINLTPADTSADTTIELAAAIAKRHRNVRSLQLPREAADSEIAAIVEAARNADIVIVGTVSADRDAGQAALVRALAECDKDPIVVALRTPYDLIRFPAVTTYVCAYSIRAVSVESVARVLFGEIAAVGTLPCTIPGI